MINHGLHGSEALDFMLHNISEKIIRVYIKSFKSVFLDGKNNTIYFRQKNSGNQRVVLDPVYNTKFSI